jgi:diguanylate cyclase (GGDEF)-like protein
MIVFDLPTLLAVTVFISGLAGCLLLLSRLQHRRIFALALWGSAFIIAAIATVLIVVVRNTVPDFWSIVIGNAILAAAYGLIWSGARNFEGKRVSIVPTLAGSLIWLSACSIGPIYAAPEARASVMAQLPSSTRSSPSENSGAGAGTAYGVGRSCCCSSRTQPLVGSLVAPYPVHPKLLTFALFEALFLCICAAYLFVSLVKDRIAARHQNVSLIDPLTGVANRRGFLHAGERLMIRTRFTNRPAALLTFDLDRFKSINDKFGHPAGDTVLVTFCRLATSQLRPTDLFGRMGGEEFASLLPDTMRQDALQLAERLRAAFEATCHTVAEQPFTATVSVGVATSDHASFDLSALLVAADQALYRAKALGRNRVELSTHSPQSPSARQASGQAAA